MANPFAQIIAGRNASAIVNPCTQLQGAYVQTNAAFKTATSNYQTGCPTANITERVQPVISPEDQRRTIATTLQQKMNDQYAIYTSYIASTKAIIAATEPLRSYKAILQGQLDATTIQNESIKQQITTNSNTVTQIAETIPDLSNSGAFGASNVQWGIGFPFLIFYSLFFILLVTVLYLRFRDSGYRSAVIVGLILLLGGAATGAYFFSVSKNYGLGLGV
jgi:hypothetical protein